MGSRAGWFFGRLISIAAMVSAALLLSTVYAAKMFPTRYLAAAGAVCAVLLVLITVLTWNTKSKARFIIGIILGLLITAAGLMGTAYLRKTVVTAKSITKTKAEVSQVGVYVNASNNDDFDSAAGSYTYGIVSAVDRKSTDQAWEKLQEDYNPSEDPKEYDSLPQLVDALRKDKVKAILMNTAFVDVLSEMDGFDKIDEEIKLVKTYDVETQVDKAEQDTDRINSGKNGDTFAMYISGIDTRSSQISAKSRSDVNIIAVVNTKTHQILLVSTPRDYYVPLSVSGGAKDKLTHAGIYGIQCSMDTLSSIYDMDLDYYFKVNFTGFENIIDALGGVTVHSDYDFSVKGYHFTQGDNNVDGKAALVFARERHAFKEGDNQRGKNQMAMIKAVISKMMSADMLKNYSSVLNAMEGSFETSMPYDKISSLVKDQLESAAGWNIVSYSATGTGSQAVPYSMSQQAYVMIPDQASIETAKKMIEQVYDGEIVSEDAAAQTEAETGSAQ